MSSKPGTKPKSGSKPKPAPSTLNTSYLLTYNAASAALWLGVLAQVVLVVAQEGKFANLQDVNAKGEVYARLERYARLVQTGALLEVGHALFGLVRAPLLTTLMQVSSRLLLVWGIAYNFPSTTERSPAYASMLVAWSVTEVVRYSYFVFTLAGAGVPGVLVWLRYNTFLILYPIGVASETWLIYKAVEPAAQIDEKLPYGLYAVLATYVPGFYMLFTYMLAQRRRILGARK